MTTGSAVVREPERSRSATSSSNLHIGALIFGAASTILVALRLLSVARFNPETAYGILQASGTATVLMGTVISLIPSIAIIAALCLALRQIFKGFGEDNPAPEYNPAVEFAIWASIFILTLIALLTTPLRYAIAAAPVVVFILIVWKFRKPIHARRNRTAGKVTATVAALLTALLLMLGVVLSPPWMPAERLTFNNAQPVTGYILAQTSSGLTVMQIKSREILYYGPSALTSQSMCSNVPANDFSVMAFPPFIKIFGFYRYAHC
jgi:hypothetical protein